MTQTSYPFDGQAATETQFSVLFREFTDTGIADSSDALALSVSGDGGGMRVFVQPGTAVLRGFAYSSDAVEQLTIAAAAGSERIDTVVIRLSLAANSIVLAVVTGTAGSGEAPALQQDESVFEFPLADVTVGASVPIITAGVIADARSFTSQEVSVWTAALRPATARIGKLGFNLTSSEWEFWDGVEYVKFVPPMPTGSIMMFADSAPPEGWHLCDGSVHGSTALETLLGSPNAPDFRDRFIVGAGGAYAKGATGGVADVTLTSAQSGLKAHGHSTSVGTNSVGHTHTVDPPATNSGTVSDWHTHTVSGGTSGGGYHTHNHYASNASGEGDANPAGAGFKYLMQPNPGGATIGSASAHEHSWSGTTGNPNNNHHHSVNIAAFTSGSQSANHNHAVTVNNNSASNAASPHTNLPPYFALTFIVKL